MIRFDKRNKRWRWEFDRYIDDGSGTTVRVRRSKLLMRGLTEEQARALAMTMESDLYVKARIVAPSDGWEAYVASMLADRKSWIYEQVVRTKYRAKTTALAGSLTPQDIADMLVRSRGRCEVTGIRFHLGRPARVRAQPFFHSIDRIDCKRGYEPWNCRVVCYAVNVAMNNWGEDVFAQLATGFVVNRYCAINILAREKSPQPPPRTAPKSEESASDVSP